MSITNVNLQEADFCSLILLNDFISIHTGTSFLLYFGDGGLAFSKDNGCTSMTVG